MSASNDLPLRQKLSWYATRRAHHLFCALAALALLGFTGSWHWIPELFSHFHFQYTILLTLLAPLVFLGRVWHWRWVALVLTLLAWALLLPSWWTSGLGNPAPQSRITLLQFNAAQNTEPLAHWLIQHHAEADVVLVLEADPTFAAAITAFEDEYPYHVERLMPGPFGIALLSRHPLTEARILDVIGPEYPALEAYVILPAGPLHLVGIHPPPPIDAMTAGLWKRFLEKLPDFLESETPTVVFGDFNATPWSPHLRAFMHATGLDDAQRGQGMLSTWPAATARYLDILGLPIDMTLVSPALLVEDRRAGPFLESDHLPVLTRLAY